MKKDSCSRLVSLLCGTVVAALVLEVALRSLSITKPDGAIFLFNAPCLPLRIPVQAVEAALRRYQQDPSLVIQYDPELGWAPRPGGISADGMYRYDQSGARTDERELPQPTNPKIVSLFGDSTMHGTGVPYQETIGAFLQDALGTTHTVKNLAVGAYGMDQAFLRWRMTHKQGRPQTVLFGFQAENVKRNGSIFRAFYTYETIDIPFSKPRFIRREQALVPINLPTIKPQETVGALLGDVQPSLRLHDYFYVPRWYSDSFVYRSRLLAFATGAIFLNNRYVVSAREKEIYAPNGDLGLLALAIMRQFRDEVQASGSEFLVVHLPRKIAVAAGLRGQEVQYSQLLQRIKTEFAVIDPFSQMLEVASLQGVDALYVDPWHYSGLGARTVGSVVAESINK